MTTKKAPFPYSQTGGGVSLPQDEPVGYFVARFVEATGIIQAVPFPDLKPPLASLLMTYTAVAFDHFLSMLDESVNDVAGTLFPHWPTPKPTDKRYGFYFYDLAKVEAHFHKLFGVRVFHGLQIATLKDWVQFRHQHSHVVGNVDNRARKRFRHYAVAAGRRVLIDADTFRRAAVELHRAANSINKRVGVVVLRTWFTTQATFRWGQDRHKFRRLLKALSYFGSLKRSSADLRDYYQAFVEDEFPSRAKLTGLQSTSGSLAARPWQ
jgi:hypothetical protein